MTERVLPEPDELSAPFWAAAAEHVLTLARCSRCGRTTLPPDVTCPHCHTTEPAFSFEPVEGGGVRQSFLPGFEADLPFVLVDVALDAQPDVRLIGRLLDGVDAPLAVGTAVTVAFEDVAPAVAVPAFEVRR
jgi:uncharacterized OB-fold protein